MPGPVVPESELATELETADALHHLHKIGFEIPLPLESIQSSTLIQGRWETVQETWQHCQAIGMVNNLVLFGYIHIACKVL